MHAGMAGGFLVSPEPRTCTCCGMVSFTDGICWRCTDIYHCTAEEPRHGVESAGFLAVAHDRNRGSVGGTR